MDTFQNSFKMSLNTQLLKNSVFAPSSLQNYFLEFKDIDYPLRIIMNRHLLSPFNKTKYSHNRQLLTDLHQHIFCVFE